MSIWVDLRNELRALQAKPAAHRTQEDRMRIGDLFVELENTPQDFVVGWWPRRRFIYRGRYVLLDPRHVPAVLLDFIPGRNDPAGFVAYEKKLAELRKEAVAQHVSRGGRAADLNNMTTPAALLDYIDHGMGGYWWPRPKPTGKKKLPWV